MKVAIILLWALFTFSSQAEASKPFAQIINMQVLCTQGGPEYLILELMEKYNEVPAYTMEITVDRPLPLAMIITENKNNPTSTVILANPNLGVSCIFMTATEAQSLPAKQPDPEEQPKLGA